MSGIYCLRELFKSMAGVDIVHVPYKSGGAVVPDLLAGRLTMNFGGLPVVTPLMREGRVRALAVTSLNRLPLVPEVPTMAESGYRGFEVGVWFGAMAPAGTPSLSSRHCTIRPSTFSWTRIFAASSSNWDLSQSATPRKNSPRLSGRRFLDGLESSRRAMPSRISSYLVPFLRRV